MGLPLRAVELDWADADAAEFCGDDEDDEVTSEGAGW